MSHKKNPPPRYNSVADLLTNDSFLAWQLKNDARHAAVWANWMAGDPANQALVTQASDLLALLVESREKRLSDYQVNMAFERLLKKIAANEKQLQHLN
ncbi:MAG TPA: hypothetical protein VL307_08480 [Chitinophagaceae bacterium]|jgi:hypothetical protein|nr:hypothetical protein [Chitinophagaceae bacterium]